MIELNALVVNFYLVLLPITLVTGLISYYKTKSIPIIILSIHAASMYFIDFLSDLFNALYQNNIFLSHIYFLVQMLLFAWFYYLVLGKNIKVRKFIIGYVLFTVVLMSMIYGLNPSKWWLFNYTETFISFYFLVLCSLIFIYQNIGKSSSFYFMNIGLLSYSFIACAHFLFQNLYFRIGFSYPILLVIHSLMLTLLQISIIFQFFYNHFQNSNGTAIQSR